MKKLTLQSNAKLNLSLDVLGKDDTGAPTDAAPYHLVQTVFCELTPQNCSNFQPDQITIEELPENAQPKPLEPDNLAQKAHDLMLEKSHELNAQTTQIKITLTKNIPLSSGLGGGSSNAATVIKGLNKLWDLKLTAPEMRTLAAKIGMDVSFFIEGGLALGEHYGEQITQLPPMQGLAFTLHDLPESTGLGENPNPNKTQQAYASLDLSKCGKNTAQTEALIHAIKTNDLFAIHKTLHNDFETLLPKPLPKNHHLTGSGPTRFVMA